MVGKVVDEMCGVTGFIGPNAANRVAWMTQQIPHRGPDAEGVWSSSAAPVALGNRRLKIIDLSSLGSQPMLSADGRWVLTFNGEIYNYLELRQELRGLGHEFRSESDTEVLLASLIEWGEGALGRLNGMFAFALWDEQEQSLLLARDHLGIKPLYYSRNGWTFAFASEVKAILASHVREPELDPRALESYLRLLWVPEPRTLFQDIYKLEPGHLLVLRNDRPMRIQAYWDVPASDPDMTHDDSMQEELSRALGRCMRRQLRADVPVGAFLSGGLDSTTVVQLAREVGHESLRSYSIAFRSDDRTHEGAADDSHFAKLVARSYSIEHQEIVLCPNVARLLPRIVWHLEDPVADPAAINCFLISEAARETSTVLLSGTGGDELFGGYRKYTSALAAEQYRRVPGVFRRGLIEPIARRLPVAIGRHGIRPVRWAKKFFRHGSAPLFERFMGFSTYYDSPELHNLLGRDPVGELDPDLGITPLREAWNRRGLGQPLDQMTYVDMKYYLPGLGLAYMDKASMAASVEVRVPLLDREVVELAARFPDRTKVRGFRTKVLLREVMKSKIPRAVLRRPKAPFAAPIRSWLRKDLDPMVHELLNPGTIGHRGLLDPSVVGLLIREHRTGREDHSLRIWALLTLEIWHQEFCDNRARFRMPDRVAEPLHVQVESEA